MVSVIANHYTLGLSDKECKQKTFRDIVKNDNIYKAAKTFELRGKWEIEAIKNVGHIMGRTEWDKACTTQINTQGVYHYCAEMLREEFYEGQWNYENCQKHSIFMSRASYPVKGLHFALEALYIVKQQFPDVKLYIAGADLLHLGIRENSYARIIKNKIKKLHLENNVEFIGNANAEEMKKRYLRANVFVSASTIENSPNSVCEAMILGVPVVSSDVGGVSSLLRHGGNGYLYSADAPYMLAWYIEKIFNEKENIEETFTREGQNVAKMRHNKEMIMKNLIEIYKNIY